MTDHKGGVMNSIGDIDSKKIELRKERIRRAWSYRSVDHIPIGFFIDDLSVYSLKELCQDGQLQFEMNFKNIDRLLRVIPDDYIPVARVWPGYMTIATMFGIEIHWSDDPNQSPGVTQHIIENIKDIYKLKMPNAREDGLMPFNLRWLRYFREKFPEQVHLTGIDLGGALNTAKDLFSTNLLYTAFYDSPVEYHHFLKMATELQIRCYEEIIEAVGDLNRLTCIDFDPFWAPEGRKGFVSDDVCATISPELFKEFSMYHNNAIFQRWRGGRIHNCGPNPSINLYLHHDPEINGLNCSYRYTKGDMLDIKEAFRGKGIVEFMFDNGESSDEILRAFEEIANVLAPDVVGIPFVWLNETWTDEEITHLYFSLRKIAEEYSRSMDWKRG